MSRCDNCFYNYNKDDLCVDALHLIGGLGCKHYKSIASKIVERCVLCGAPNDQQHLGKQYCSQCEKKYVR